MLITMSKKFYLPALAITLVVLTACGKPNDSSSSDTAVAAARKAQIDKDCGTSKEETEAWFATHTTGWAEHVEAGLKCIREHPLAQGKI
ncbi:hypothetical protein MasN3_39750 [Massilia varians]|uniref:Lipoprotein n=1 Tax=Massilia varians TaxID=457921 RepID=A0ABN6TFP7_9BURK|nr:hypothetical protein [Massilia varians]BDT60481.1 hypothetical protein MasN3_39750 [Massilia varians]